MDLPIGTLFANPTVASIVRQIHALRGDVIPEGKEENNDDEEDEQEDKSKNLETLVDQDLRLVDGMSFDTSLAGERRRSNL